MHAAAVALSVVLVAWGACQRDEQRRARARRDTRTLVEKGTACFSEGRYDCAMEAFSAASKREPRRADLWNRLAISARLRFYVTGDGDFRDQELEALRRAAALDAGSAHVQVNLGTVCWEMGLREEAARAYRAALRLAPSHADAELMGERIQRAGREEEQE